MAHRSVPCAYVRVCRCAPSCHSVSRAARVSRPRLSLFFAHSGTDTTRPTTTHQRPATTPRPPTHRGGPRVYWRLSASRLFPTRRRCAGFESRRHSTRLACPPASPWADTLIGACSRWRRPHSAHWWHSRQSTPAPAATPRRCCKRSVPTATPAAPTGRHTAESEAGRSAPRESHPFPVHSNRWSAAAACTVDPGAVRWVWSRFGLNALVHSTRRAQANSNEAATTGPGPS